MGARSKLSYDDVKNAIKYICKSSESQDKILVQVGDVQTALKIEYDIEVTGKTIRDYGLRRGGYFQKKYPKACSYNNDNDSKYRGLMIKPEKFLAQVT